MRDDDFDTAACVDRAAGLLGLDLDPAHRPGVIANFERIGSIARLFLDFPLAETDEAAPVFEP